MFSFLKSRDTVIDVEYRGSRESPKIGGPVLDYSARIRGSDGKVIKLDVNLLRGGARDDGTASAMLVVREGNRAPSMHYIGKIDPKKSADHVTMMLRQIYRQQ